MAINVENAFDIDQDGLVIRDNDGNVLHYMCAGSGLPNGSSAPQNTFYFDQNTQLIHYKYGAGNNDWRQLRAEDVTFDDSTTDITADNVQEAIQELDSVAFGKDFAYKTKLASESTTGSIFDTYDELTFTVTNTATNVFRLNSSFIWHHNSASNDIRVRIQLDGVTLSEMRVEPKDAGGDQDISSELLWYVENLSIGSHTLSLQYRPATSARTSSMDQSTLEVWRTI